MGYLEDLVTVTIARDSRTPSRQSFGVPLIAAYHTRFAGRVKSYGELSELVADGFNVYDPAYRIAQAIFAQSPAPPAVKIGRRALPMTQVVSLTPAAPVSDSAAEVYAVKIYGLTATFTSDATPTVGEVRTGLAAAINALGDASAIIATGGASAIASQTITAFNGVVGGAAMTPPRMISLSLSSHADWDATTATITGTDANGSTQVDTITIPNGGGAVGVGTKRFRTVTSITIPAQSGTGGTFTLGTRAPVSAAVVSSAVVCTGVAGQLVSYELATSNIALADMTEDPGITTDLDAIFAASSDWYGLLLDSNSKAEVCTASTGAAAWTEANKRLLVTQTADSAAKDSESTTDFGYLLSAAGYLRTAWSFYPAIGVWKVAAWAGEELPKDPGKSTWALKTLATIPSYAITSAERAAIEAKNGNHYLVAGGVAITNPGKVAGGEWIDAIRAIDSLTADLKADVFGVSISNDIVPFTDAGISLHATAVRARLTTAVEVGILADDPKFVLTVPRASAVSSSDRQARRLTGLRFTARLAGAIQTLDINGRVAA